MSAGSLRPVSDEVVQLQMLPLRRRPDAETGRSTRTLTLCALLTVAMLTVGTASASAHATLEATTPQSGASLVSAPTRVLLRFDEPVETALSTVRVSDSRGHEVQKGRPFHPEGDASALAVRLRTGIPKAGYATTFRVVSADSHPMSGGFTFDIGGAEQASAAGLLGRHRGGPVSSVALDGARAVQYAAIALGIGVLSVLFVAWLPALSAVATPEAPWPQASEAFARWSRLLLVTAAVAGTSSALLAPALLVAAAESTSLWSALGDAPEVLATRFGTVWGLATLAWLAVFTIVHGNAAVVPVLRPGTVGTTGVALRGRIWLRAAAVPLSALALLPALTGHAGVRPPVAVLLPANLVHVAAAGTWIGGLAVLVFALPAATRRLDDPQRSELLTGVLTRFSTLALAAVGVLLASGVLQSLLELRTLDDLLDTAFGRAVTIKIVLAVALVACGGVNRRRTLPALRRPATGRMPGRRASILLRRTLRTELALGVGALAITGALAGYQPTVPTPHSPVIAPGGVHVHRIPQAPSHHLHG